MASNRTRWKPLFQKLNIKPAHIRASLAVQSQNDSKKSDANLVEVEPVVGFEPTTDGLQNRCSTTELNWPQSRRILTAKSRGVKGRTAAHLQIMHGFPMIETRARRVARAAGVGTYSAQIMDAMSQLGQFDQNFLLANCFWGAVASGYMIYGWRQRSLIPFLGGFAMMAVSCFAPALTMRWPALPSCAASGGCRTGVLIVAGPPVLGFASDGGLFTRRP